MSNRREEVHRRLPANKARGKLHQPLLLVPLSRKQHVNSRCLDCSRVLHRPDDPAYAPVVGSVRALLRCAWTVPISRRNAALGAQLAELHAPRPRCSKGAAAPDPMPAARLCLSCRLPRRCPAPSVPMMLDARDSIDTGDAVDAEMPSMPSMPSMSMPSLPSVPTCSSCQGGHGRGGGRGAR